MRNNKGELLREGGGLGEERSNQLIRHRKEHCKRGSTKRTGRKNEKGLGRKFILAEKKEEGT